MKITALTNGPLLVQGAIALVDQTGRAYFTRDLSKFALCRCGGSKSKPFCDGSHARNGFRAPPLAELADAAAVTNWETEGGSVRAPAAPDDRVARRMRGSES